MAQGIRAKLTSAPFNATHLWMMNDKDQDSGSAGLSPSNPLTSFQLGEVAAFAKAGICTGVTNSFSSGTTPGFTYEDGCRTTNTNDINIPPLGYASGTRTVMFWTSCVEVVSDVTCYYEQGGGINNVTFAQIAGTIIFQVADDGQPFLIAKMSSQVKAGRALLLSGVWEHHSNHAGAGNRILFIVNGVLEEIVEGSGTETFPSHTGDIAFGNTADVLRTYNDQVMQFGAWEKSLNMFGMYNNLSITESMAREVFEQTVKAEVDIFADTRANQQAALDTLTGNLYTDVNCAIKIFPATDTATPILTFDNINFRETTNLEDISVQWVGTGVLELESANGTDIIRTSTPSEVNTTNNVAIDAGGTVTHVLDVLRINTLSNQSNLNHNRIVITQAGTYEFDNVRANEIRNASVGNVIINAINGTDITTNLDAGTIVIQTSASLTLTDMEIGSDVVILQAGTDIVLDSIDQIAGTTFTYNYTTAQNIDIGVIKQGFVPLYIYNFILTGINANLPRKLSPDRTYQQ